MVEQLMRFTKQVSYNQQVTSKQTGTKQETSQQQTSQLLSSPYCKTLIWDCRRNQILPNITGFKFKVRLKYEVELYIGSYGKKKDILRNKGAGFQDLLLQE